MGALSFWFKSPTYQIGEKMDVDRHEKRKKDFWDNF